MTTFYLDTEFNGHGGQLISLALVSPCGKLFYEVCQLPYPVNDWVKENVIPKLVKEPWQYLPHHVFRTWLYNFLVDLDNPEIICDWHKDAVHFLNLLESPEYGSSLDFACRITILKTPPGQPPEHANQHNALADAIALMNWHQNVTAGKAT